MKILIFGASGQLGLELSKILQGDLIKVYK